MTDAFEWQGKVGETWASEWQRTDRSLAAVQDALLRALGERMTNPQRILDIGCGAGSTTITAAARFPEAGCTGIDLSSALIDVARSRAAATDCRFVCADASSWSDPAFPPDALISRHGVMFFDDPVAAFRHLGACAAPGARLVFSCFRSASENEWATSMMDLLPAQPPADPLAPGPFAFADPNRVSALLSAAGWQDAQPQPLDWDYVAGAGQSAVADALDFFQHIGPAARASRSLDRTQRADFMEKLERLLADHLFDGRVSFRAAGWIWTAHR